VDSNAQQANPAAVDAQQGYEPPMGPTESLVAQIWQQVLQVPRIGRHDNFFEIGGESLQTLHIVHLLKAAGVRVELPDLFGHQTVAELAAHLATSNADLRPAVPAYELVPIRASGSSRPLFLIHELTGSLVYGHMLAPHIEASIPIYGLPPVKTGAGLPPLPEMARQMVAAIIQAAGDGPYRIAGWSFGGVVAYEVAWQLLALGRQVEFLGLIDAHYKSDGGPSLSSTLDDKSFLLVMLRVANAGNAARLAEVNELGSTAATMDFAALVEHCRVRSLLPFRVAELPQQDILRVLTTMRAVFAIEEAYVAGTMAGPLHLFAPRDGQAYDPLRGWGAVVTPESIRVIPVSGNHLTLMDPAMIGSLGAAMTQAILGRAPVCVA